LKYEAKEDMKNKRGQRKIEKEGKNEGECEREHKGGKKI
jgi:hypothetical protein